VLLRAQQVSCDDTLEYFTYLEVPKMSFGKESTRTDQPNFPPQRFLTKAILTKWTLKFFDLIFRPSNLPAKKTMSCFRSISLNITPYKQVPESEFFFLFTAHSVVPRMDSRISDPTLSTISPQGRGI
jgi:hypothetical protein